MEEEEEASEVGRKGKRPQKKRRALHFLLTVFQKRDCVPPPPAPPPHINQGMLAGPFDVVQGMQHHVAREGDGTGKPSGESTRLSSKVEVPPHRISAQPLTRPDDAVSTVISTSVSVRLSSLSSSSAHEREQGGMGETEQSKRVVVAAASAAIDQGFFSAAV